MNVRFPWLTRWMWNVIHGRRTMRCSREWAPPFDIIWFPKCVWWKRTESAQRKSFYAHCIRSFTGNAYRFRCASNGWLCACGMGSGQQHENREPVPHSSVVASSVKTASFNNFVVFEFGSLGWSEREDGSRRSIIAAYAQPGPSVCVDGLLQRPTACWLARAVHQRHAVNINII